MTEDSLRYGLSFGRALEHMRSGERVSRDTWQGHNQFLFLAQKRWGEISLPVPPHVIAPGCKQDASPFFCLRTGLGTLEPWTPVHADLLATDWFVLDSPR